MSLSHKLSLEQKQSLVLTKDLQQAIKLLQLSSQELEIYLDEALQENPLLEYVEEESESEKIDQTENQALDFEASNHDELDLVQVKPTSPYRDDEDSRDALDQVTEEVDLRAHLTRQLFLETDVPLHRAIGSYIIDCLDENGYIRTSIEEIETQLGCQRGEVEKILSLLQQFDPIGIFARNLQECLALQLKEQNELDPLMMMILKNLDIVGRKDLKTLVEITGENPEKILKKIEKIKSLNPRPACDFAKPLLPISRPDLIVTSTPDKKWRVDFNPEAVPQIRMNHPYYENLKSSIGAEKEGKDYIKNCFHTGNWLLKAVEQRTQNILKVARAIIDYQTAFLDEGVHALKPLLMKEIAAATDLSESTISRVTDHKYMLTPRGLFELKFFFTTAVESRYTGHEAHSAEAVRHKIKALVESEKYPNILADDMLVMLLRQEGIDIARRTVSKYREAMGISSSFVRKKQKKPFNLVG